jgi:hypothetical protein
MKLSVFLSDIKIKISFILPQTIKYMYGKEYECPDYDQLGIFLFVTDINPDGEGDICIGYCLLDATSAKHKIINCNDEVIGYIFSTTRRCITKTICPTFTDSSMPTYALYTKHSFAVNALHTFVNQFGLRLPKWIFHCGIHDKTLKVDKRVYETILKHIQNWTSDPAEQLAQLVGALPWSVPYFSDRYIGNQFTLYF